MFLDGTLQNPYGNSVIQHPKEDTAVEFLMQRLSDLCKEGHGHKKWLTNAETGEFCSINQAEAISRQVASGMFKRGMRHGDVMLFCSNEATWLHAFILGVWKANGTMRASYPEDTVETMVERILESKVKWILCDPKTAAESLCAASQAPWEVEVICFGNPPEGCISTGEIMGDDASAVPDFTLTQDDVAVILNTSGTTGASKGAMYTQRGLAKLFGIYHRPSDAKSSSSTLIMSKATHFSGFCLPFGALAGGKQLFQPETIFGFPKYLMWLANDPDASKYDFSSLRAVISGGAVITPSFIKTIWLQLRLPVVNSYGMTECGTFTTTRNLETNSAKQACESVPDFSVGKLIPGTILQVRDIITGQPLGPNQEGELFFKSEFSCAGYLNNPEETKRTFPDGWIRTGDLGYFDDSGFIFVVDRIKEIFKYYNNHISPSELENWIQRHPAVDNVCVVGVPDPEGGDSVPRAFVTLKDSGASPDEIRQFVDANVASYKKLRGGVVVLDEMPVGKTGKVERRVLSQMKSSTPQAMVNLSRDR